MTLLSGGPARPTTPSSALDAPDFLSGAAALAIGVEHRLELTRRDLVHPVTGLPNRTALVDRLDEAIAQRARLDEMLGDCGLPPVDRVIAAVSIDLDHFQRIGSAVGPTAGDGVLRSVADRIGTGVHAGDTVAQIGDDEFVVVCSHLADAVEVEHFADAVVAHLRTPIELTDGREVTITASAGAAVWSESDSPGTLLAHSATALGAAKDAGRNRAVRFVPGVAAEAVDELALRVDVQRALVRGELIAHFQPIVDLPDGRVVGFETLVRWDHPERGILTPIHFLDAVRGSGLGVALGELVLREACRFARRLIDATPADGTTVTPYVTVNIDNEHLCARGFVDAVADALAAAGIDGSHLVLELVESDRIDPDGDGAAVLDAVRSLGVALAIDDFGTGYSSLGYLQRLPVQMIKLDGTFVRDVTDNPGDRAIVALVVEAASVLGISVTAECVEDDAQVAALVDLGCRRAQGYRFARPLGPDEALAHWERTR